MDEPTLRDHYEARIEQLREVACRLRTETDSALNELPHVDRISYRVKDVESFLAKAWRRADPPYVHPLEEIEDQIAGRVLVFFLDDINPVVNRLSQRFRPVESSRRFPDSEREFDYESHHLVCMIPPDVTPDAWEGLGC